MARAPKIYRKLPGHGATLSHRVRLYLGPDHLLQVSSTGFTETYRRFYFRDMQSITIRTTIAGRVVNAIFGGFVAIFATLALVASGVGTVVLGCFAVLFAIVLGANVALGPTA
ncbi:MAG: hypothetical protein L0Y58_16110, partial [Verrucomicrobia subdivision 3 bacterium]|nr:hypothetical protein [Limisphaerales bacterium]